MGQVLLRSGAERGGVEAGVPGIWAQAVAAAAPGGSTSGRLHLTDAEGGRLDTQVALGPFLPLAEGSAWDPSVRTFLPGQPAWNAAHSAGGALARVELVGAENRHRIWFGAQGAQTAVTVPASPAVGGSDPASEPNPRLRVTLLSVPGGSASGGLREPGVGVTAYSRWVAP